MTYFLGYFLGNQKLSEVKQNSLLKDIERDFEELRVDSFSQLITDEKIREKVEQILAEYEYEKYTSLRVPTTLTIEDMSHLLSCFGFFERKKLIQHLFLKEILRLKAKDKQIENKDKYLAEKHEKWSQMDCQKTGLFDNKGDLVYGLWHNSMVAKIFKYHCNKLFNHRLRNAALFGQKLVIDLDYDQYMKFSECRQLAKQLALLYSYNKYKTREPFDLHFTNCNFQTPTMEAIPNYLINYNSPNFLSTFHTKSYLDLFPKERLVYLTPNANESLKNYDFDDIYIIGGFVDKSCHEPISLVKAKKEGIRSVRLPLDEHIIWGSGSKSLCLNQIIAILHDVRESGDWKKSLNDNIPKSKKKKIEEIEYENFLRNLKYRKSTKKENLKRGKSLD